MVSDDRGHPGSGGSSNGLKHALVTSRNSRSALPPSLVPKRVGGPGSSEAGAMLDGVRNGQRVGTAFRAVGGFTRVEAGCVFADEGVGCDESD
jgi:hypothetical protein